MKEVMNAFKGIKEPMHVIMEEEEMYERSFIGSPLNLSDFQGGQSDMNESIGLIATPSKPESLDNSYCNFGTPMSTNTQFTIESPKIIGDDKQLNQFDFNDPDQKEGHLLFNVLRGEIVKAFSLKAITKADIYLDRITFIARKMINIWYGKQTSVENFNMFVDMLKEKAYLISFPVMLESFRRMNCFELDPIGYQPFCELMLASLTEVVYA